MVKIFGGALDALDIPERVEVKRAYLNFILSNPDLRDDYADPFSYVEGRFKNRRTSDGNVEWIGKFPVDSWLTPKPSISDLNDISRERYTRFLDRNGCRDYYNKLLQFLRREMGSSIPVMIGVDHCLTGAVLEYVKQKYERFNVLVFDSHCDMIDLETRRRYFDLSCGGFTGFQFGKDVYECGSFLSRLMSDGIVCPEYLWIVGSQDLAELRRHSDALFAEKITPWLDRGLHVITKDQLLTHGIPQAIQGPTYISFDMDLGSLSSVFAARFLNYPGIDRNQFLNVISDVSEKIEARSIELIGLDIMEIDVHFLDAEFNGIQDCTGELAEEIIDRMIYRNSACGEV